MFPEDRYNQLQCTRCEAADAVCAAYRHILKDIIRGDPKNAVNAAIVGLDNDRMNYLGQLFHRIVKAAMILDKHMTDQESTDFKAAVIDLHTAVENVMKNPGATVRGWMGPKV